jgi:hypothetical protein
MSIAWALYSGTTRVWALYGHCLGTVFQTLICLGTVWSLFGHCIPDTGVFGHCMVTVWALYTRHWCVWALYGHCLGTVFQTLICLGTVFSLSCHRSHRCCLPLHRG